MSVLWLRCGSFWYSKARDISAHPCVLVQSAAYAMSELLSLSIVVLVIFGC
jgi:hypothetical protein